MEENNSWPRRKFSKAVLSMQALIATGVLNIPLGCATKEHTKESKMLSPSLQNLLQFAMDEIIPKSDKMPAVSEVQGIQYILSVFEEHPDFLEGFRQILIALDTQSKSFTNNEFENLKRNARISVLKQFEKEQPRLFSVLRDIAYESYYINENVWKLIGYKPYPTLSAGPEMEPFDEKLLDRVKQLPSLYKNA